MQIRAFVRNERETHAAVVRTGDSETTIGIEPKQGGRGSAVNGGELLFLALATCYCNDIYREADEAGIEVHVLEVRVRGQFGAKGDPASNVSYDVKISANASREEIERLLRHTDTVAEIQNTMRKSVPVRLAEIEIEAPEA